VTFTKDNKDDVAKAGYTIAKMKLFNISSLSQKKSMEIKRHLSAVAIS